MKRWRWPIVALLLVGVVLLSLTPSSSEARAAKALRKLGAEITRAEDRPGKPVVAVNLSSTEIKAADLDYLRDLPHLERLDLARAPLTDEGLAHLEGLEGLRVLNLSGTKVTDAGLAHLEGLRSLEELRLARTSISDRGLAHLQGLAKLRSLSLLGTTTSAAGVARLRKALPGCRIER